MTGPRFSYCPACARDLAPPATPQENQENEAFDLTAPRCSGCGHPWLGCSCSHAAEGAVAGAALDMNGLSAGFLSDVAGKVRRGELGPVDAALVVTVDATNVPNRLGTAVHRLDQNGLLFVLEGTVASMKQGVRATKGGILLPN